MTFTLGILGGGLQGLEAALIAKLSGWNTVVMDGKDMAPAAKLATKFVAKKAQTILDLENSFHNCDAILPANENLSSLELVDKWHKLGSSPPVAFDLKSFRISRDKEKSKKLFLEAQAPVAASYPGCDFPLIAKPTDRSGSQGVTLIKNKEELERLFPEGNTKGYLFEEYCPGPSYSLELTGKPHNYKTWVATYLEMDSSYDCRAVWSPVADAALEESFAAISVALAEKLELIGLMDIEVIDTPKGLIVLEIDARFPSQTPVAVYLSSGVNLLAELLSLFTKDVPQELQKEPMFSLLEHLDVKNGQMSLMGEHRIAQARPLSLKENFFGAPLALTDMEEGDTSFAATIICRAKTQAMLKQQRREIYERLGLHLGTNVPKEIE
ncbi:MAG: 3-methylornithine--L-lysine ligase PylC [Deltaproteobacteria bacterium]|jgi:pyrrolysine biosynthesis protein PylC|nr:3-methylornithine--L-lysine ligase PylC [Deltaproteobacteria bacterium]